MGFDPVSMAVIGTIGAVTSAAGTYGSYQAQSANASYQAQVAANNAQIAKHNEALEMQAGSQQTTNREMKARSDVARTKTGQAAGGIDVNSGSAVDVRAGEAETGMLDALTIRTNAARRAYGYAVQSTSDTAESGLLASESKQASEAAPFAAGGSLLTNISSVGSKYAAFENASG